MSTSTSLPATVRLARALILCLLIAETWMLADRFWHTLKLVYVLGIVMTAVAITAIRRASAPTQTGQLCDGTFALQQHSCSI